MMKRTKNGAVLISLVFMFALMLSSCGGGGGGGVAPDEGNTAKMTELSKINPDVDRTRDLVLESVAADRKAAKTTLSTGDGAPANGSIHFERKEESRVIGDDGLGYIIYSFTYLEWLLDGTYTAKKGTIKFQYEWDEVGGAWKEKSAVVTEILDWEQIAFSEAFGCIKNTITQAALKDAMVYGISEKTKDRAKYVTKTSLAGEDGCFSIPKILTGGYKFYVSLDQFKIGETSETAIDGGKKIDLGTIYLIPSDDSTEQTGTLKGVVKFMDDTFDGGAVVSLWKENEATSIMSAQTDENGAFTMDEVPVGINYIVRVTSESLVHVETGVVIKNNETTDISIKLNNIPPEISGITISQNSPIKKGDKVTFRANISDLDGDELTVTWSYSPVINSVPAFDMPGAGQTIAWTAPETGRYTIYAMVSDNKGGKAQGSIEVEVLDTIATCKLGEEIDPDTGKCVPTKPSFILSNLSGKSGTTASVSVYTAHVLSDIQTFSYQIIIGNQSVIEMETVGTGSDTKAFNCTLGANKKNVLCTTSDKKNAVPAGTVEEIMTMKFHVAGLAGSSSPISLMNIQLSDTENNLHTLENASSVFLVSSDGASSSRLK